MQPDSALKNMDLHFRQRHNDHQTLTSQTARPGPSSHYRKLYLSCLGLDNVSKVCLKTPTRHSESPNPNLLTGVVKV